MVVRSNMVYYLVTIYSLTLLWVVPPILRLGPLGFAHTPPPELSVNRQVCTRGTGLGWERRLVNGSARLRVTTDSQTAFAARRWQRGPECSAGSPLLYASL